MTAGLAALLDAVLDEIEQVDDPTPCPNCERTRGVDVGDEAISCPHCGYDSRAEPGDRRVP